MSTKYMMISQVRCYEGKYYAVYGIEAVGDTPIKIHDITTDKDKLMKMIEKLNRNMLSEIHIQDICDDFLVYNS